MNNMYGWIREKLGRSTHKAILVVPIAETQRVYPTKKPDGEPFNEQKTEKMIKLYEGVKKHYFRPYESLWKDKKTGTYELHAENTSYQQGEAKLQFINRYNGAPVSFDEVATVTFTPEALTQVTAAEWVRNAHASVKGLGMGTMFAIILFSFGIVVGALVGLNWEAIVTTLSPPPSPPPM